MSHHKANDGELVWTGRIRVTLDTFYASNEPAVIRTLDAKTRLFLELRMSPILRLLSRLLGTVFSAGEVVTTTERTLSGTNYCVTA
ncbi:MAG: hypothetical protein IBX67_04630 [Dehalococcoidia bacterium]|nr:hypothetical protein [Dehalococcoidia bacterium]